MLNCMEICPIGLTKLRDSVKNETIVPIVSTPTPCRDKLDTPAIPAAPPRMAINAYNR